MVSPRALSGAITGVVVVLLSVVSTAPAAPPGAAAKGAAPGKKADRGDMKVSFEKTTKYKALADVMRAGKILDEVVEDLNASLLLPKNLPVVFRECKAVNAYFDPNTGKINMCYELVQFFAEKLAVMDEDGDTGDADEDAVGVVKFTFLHELGHALIDLFEIDYTGREEDVADQLATFLLIQSDDAQAAIAGAEGMAEIDRPEEVAQVSGTPFWDEHSLGQQRFFNIVCWVYGSNPKENHKLLVGDKDSPLNGKESRAERCEREYDVMARAWSRLLDPYVREPAK